MPIAFTMKDTLVQTIVDEDFASTLVQLNLAAAKGMNFVAMSDMQGGHVMLNIPQILMAQEIEDD